MLDIGVLICIWSNIEQFVQNLYKFTEKSLDISLISLDRISTCIYNRLKTHKRPQEAHMTTWTTFETIDETERFTEFFIDRLGMHSYRQDERTRFELKRMGNSEWLVEDLDADGDQYYKFQGSMRDVIQWVAGRILYGA